MRARAAERWLLDGLDDSAIELPSPGVRRLMYRFGVRSFRARLDHGRNAEHYFYLEREGCPTLVAVIDLWALSGVGCRRIPGQPLCELLTNEQMIHGDQQASTWHFDGIHYIEVDTRLLAPRPPKKRR